ncbi:MAG: enterotoxin A family protein, partial [Gammaproteobacteria bacterium]|nr:enterotoxin A family protein [Gammaproteobacteria bacterium]
MSATGKDAKKEEKKKEESTSGIDAAKYGFGVIFRGEALPVPTEHWYRGDNAKPKEVHAEGFKAQGTNMDIISHARPVDGNASSSASGYVSTTTSIDVALRHPYEFPAGTNRSFIYEIAPQSNAVDVPKAFIANPADPRESAYIEDYWVNIAHEHEKAIPRKIEARDIRGAWPVEIIHQDLLVGKMHPSAIESSDYIRTPKMSAQEFIPNPYYLPRSGSEPKVFEYGVHLAPPNIAVSAAAVGAIQTISLIGTGYALYEAGQLVIKSDHPVQEAQKQASLFSAAVIVGSQVGAIATPYCLRGALFHPPTAPVTFP